MAPPSGFPYPVTATDNHRLLAKYGHLVKRRKRRSRSMDADWWVFECPQEHWHNSKLQAVVCVAKREWEAAQ